ncbi:RNA degradosome polyphosphate kinase [Nakamurella aerolata]|uniref:RNA degradosome polyphosphate kinase n=1 Tax=Nakamurella aerolata TaxID=1656892 RepID=UPI0031B56748
MTDTANSTETATSTGSTDSAGSPDGADSADSADRTVSADRTASATSTGAATRTAAGAGSGAGGGTGDDASDGAGEHNGAGVFEPFHARRSEAADQAQAARPDTDPLPADRFHNRELSWLEFNERVLALAERTDIPLLERAKFLAIFSSNLDEFYMVRVAGLKRRREMGLSVLSADGLTAGEQLRLISRRAQELIVRQGRVFVDEVQPALEAAGIKIVHWNDIAEPDRQRLHEYFSAQIFPVLTPLAVDPAHPFPYISGLSLSMAVIVRDPQSGVERFARVKVPNNVDRFVRVRPDLEEFLPLEDLLAAHLRELFPGMEVVEYQVFRVTRNEDLEVDEDRDEDLLKTLERELARRRFGPPVRLEITDNTSQRVLDLLLGELGVDPSEAVEVPGLLDLSSLWQLHGLDRPELKDAPFVPATNPAFAERETPKSVFARLRETDVLLHHPYESFATTAQRFIQQAAADPNVLAIKQTLYRTSGDSPIVDALIEAAAAGKQVVAVVEIKARFDELANISWAKALEQAGVHVVYGLVGLKTHCKAALVVRQEGSVLRRYCHVGTGNYNWKTARIYEDLGLLTADPDIGADLTDLFNVLTGYSRQTEYRNLLVAPHSIRSGIIERIDAEIAHQQAGRPSGIQLKMNSIVDERVIDALYQASRAGVPVDLTVRGICALRAGVPGLSENITVRSIVGRFLEHSRVFAFAGGGNPELWIGSADMMHRNLDRRVEALVQLKDPATTAPLRGLLDMLRADDIACWLLGPDGWSYREGVDLQERLLRDGIAGGE